MDNCEPWRRYVSCTLEKREGFQVVGETGDGLEAVRKAIALRPDLVLLDLCLSGLNGIEAAKQIIEAVPGVKLLFATQDRDAEIMKAALSNGAHGYILKIDVNHELVPAINAILLGEKFLSGASKRPNTF